MKPQAKQIPIMKSGDGQEAQPLAEELLAVDSCSEWESQFF